MRQDMHPDFRPQMHKVIQASLNRKDMERQ